MSPFCYLNLQDNRLYYRKTDPGVGYKQMVKLREESEDKDKFDEELKKSVQLNHKDLMGERLVWDIFDDKIMRFTNLLQFQDNFYDLILCVARGFIREGVFHIEARQSLNNIKDEVY